MKINELRIGMSNINLNAKVIGISEPREVMTKFGTATTLVEAVLQDESGSIKLTLWGKQAEDLEEGN